MVPPTKGSAASATKAKPVKETTAACPPGHTQLTVIEITFSGNHQINKDTLAEFTAPEWVLGRTEQSPVCYTRNKHIQLTAKFRVSRPPLTDETVQIQGSAQILKGIWMKWTGHVTVHPSEAEVVLRDVVSDIPLANWITYFDPFLIDWNFQPAGTSWATAGQTKNLLYVVLADPLDSPLYWTVVDVSCRAANGKQTENTTVPAIYKPFKGAQATPPKPIKRKRDGVILTYWLPESDPMFTTAKLLGNPSGCGRCGAWSLFMIDMCRAHGISSAQQIGVAPSGPWGKSTGMLVKNWSFTRHPDLTPPHHEYGIDFTHYVRGRMGHRFILPSAVTTSGGCQDEVGVAAQGNPDPFPAFFDHAIVKHNGTFYDPSYGTPETDSELQWEKNSLDGIFCQTATATPGVLVAVAGKHPGTQVFNFEVT